MIGIIDSNFLYYMLQLNSVDVKPFLFDKVKKSSVMWQLSDIAFIESILHNKNNESNVKKIHDLYKEQKDNIKIFFPDFCIKRYLEKCDCIDGCLFEEILQYKLKKETSYLIELFHLISVTYKEYCEIKYNLQAFSKKINKNFNSFWSANKNYLSGLMQKELLKLYKNDRFKLHRILRQHLFGVLFCIEWNLTAGIEGYDIGTLRDKMEQDGLVPNIPNRNELTKIIDAINYGSENEDGSICNSQSKMLTNEVFENLINNKASLNGSAIKEFKKEIIRRIFNEEACVMKNDFWDSIFMNLGSEYCVLTYDKKFKNLMKVVNKPMYDNLEVMIQNIESQTI